MKRISKFLIKIHKASGSLLSLMFVVWFISGIVLIFDGFPHASREDRFLHLQELKPLHFENLQAPSPDFRGEVSLEICDGKPVYRVQNGRKAKSTFNAETLEPVSCFSENYAVKLSEAFLGSTVKEVQKMNDLDQWVPWSYYKPLLPFFKCTMNDPAHTVMYVSEKTGEIIQQTTRKSRWSARFGAIPHWIYFKQLKSVGDTWRIVVIILSGLGVLMSLTGVYAGIVRLKKRKQKGLTPYKKFWFKWHHLIGFFFGLFVFTFILSGLISVTSIPDWMVGVNSTEKVKVRWNEKLDLNGQQTITPKAIYNALNKKQGIRKIEWKTVFGQPQYQVYYDDYQIPEVYALQNGKIEALTPFSLEDVKLHAKEILRDIQYIIKPQPGYDYYYAGSAMRYLSEQAIKIELEDAAETWIYINPASGAEVKRLTKNSRVRRWLYRFLHTFDIPPLKKVDGLRKTILILLSIGGIVVSFTGLVLSRRWFNRNLRKVKVTKLFNG